MADADSPESPLAAAAEMSGERVTEAFSLLSNDTRLAILLALWEAYDPFPDGTWDPTAGKVVPFSDLRERVGMRDSGQFNYHLGKLEGHFVEQTPDGYQLLPAGQQLVRTVIAGAGFEEPTLDPTEIDLACQYCGAPSAITYQNQRIYHVCTACDGSFELREKHPENTLSAWIANPNVLRERDATEIFEAVITEAHHQFITRIGGVCPECSGRLDTSLDVCTDHDAGGNLCPACGRRALAVVRYVCTACKHTSVTTLEGLSHAHPAMGAFAWHHGIELGYGQRDLETAKWLLYIDSEQELVSAEPPRVRVTHRYENDEIRLTFDEELNAVEVAEDYRAVERAGQ